MKHLAESSWTTSWTTSPRFVRRLVITAALALSGSTLTVSYAGAQSCESLWVERNTIYKEAGYCFKTPRAIAYFGNAGCTYDSEAAVPLTPYQRARIDEIVRIERRWGCN